MNLTSELAQFWDSFRARERLSVCDWALKYRYLAKGVTSKPGKYSLDAGPYQREPQESFTDPDVMTTVLMWASRTGKTETLNNLDGYIIHHDPKAILKVYPTLDSATKWRKEFFNPLISATPVLRGRINIKSRNSDNTMLAIRFPGGNISSIGTNSPSGFRQIQAPVVECDEIDAMEDGKEGDPITLAFKRADNYPDSIQVLSSTPTVKGHSRIESWLDKSDYRMWFCPCVKCGRHQVLRWSQVQWPEDRPQDAFYACEHEGCAHHHNDAERAEMIRAGEWRPTRPFNGIRGYWLNGINTLFPAKKGYQTKLHQMASEFIDAKRSDNAKESLRVWTNTFLAETYREKEDTKQDHNALAARREDYTPATIPRGVVMLRAGVDVQADRLECEIVGFGPREESWGIEHIVLPGDPREALVWQQLEAKVGREFIRADGVRLKVSGVGVDTGYALAIRQAYAFILPRQPQGWRAVKGSSAIDAPLVARAKASRVDRVMLLMVGVNRIKALIYDRALLADADERPSGFMHFPQSYSLRWFEQFLSEDSRPIFKSGNIYREFYVPVGEGKSKRNEALDMRVYALAMLYNMGAVNWEGIEELNLKTKPGAIMSAPTMRAPGRGWSV